MSWITYSAKDGALSCNAATIQAANLTVTTGQKVSQLRRNFITRWRLSIIAGLWKTLPLTWKSTGSTVEKATNRATSASLPGRSSAGISQPRSLSNSRGRSGPHGNGQSLIARSLRRRLLVWHERVLQVRRSLQGRGRKIPVYDLVNVGEKHRFSTANLIVHNCLGLGYGAGATTFRNVARIMAGLELSAVEAKNTVNDFRRSNPKITALWANLEQRMQAKVGSTFFMRLPSGRTVRYFNVENSEGLTATTVRGGRTEHFYGGKLTENIVQATARDVFAENVLRLDHAGVRILWTTHDEVVAECPESDAQALLELIEREFVHVPDWMPGLPLAAETMLSAHYCK